MPNYGEILKVVGQQLALRKGDIFKRTLLVVWPFALLFGYLQFARDDIGSTLATFASHNPVLSITLLVCGILVLMLYYVIISSIVTIEKYLWIDSTFDGKSMDSKRSWHVAWKLLIPLCLLSVEVAIRYYLLPICLLVGAFVVAFVSAPYIPLVISSYQMVMAILYVVLAIVFVVYMYFLRIKLRFVYFLFIDRYNKTTFTYSALFDEMEQLNAVCKTESFKKALILNLGSDAIGDIAGSVVSVFHGAVASFGRVGSVVGAVLRPVADESTRQFASFARLTAIYLLYINARAAINAGAAQETNGYVYEL